MVTIPSRQDWAKLTDAARAIVPTAALGFARSRNDGCVSLLYSYRPGSGEFVVPQSDLPAVLHAQIEGTRQADAATLEAHPAGALEAFLLENSVERVVSIPVAGVEPATRFWVGIPDSAPLTDDQMARLETVAKAGTDHLLRPVPARVEIDTLRRLEQATGLLPALLRVLDVRQVFDRLSIAATRALPHDLLLLILFNEDLSTYTIYARSDRGSDVSAVHPNTYPATAIQAWEFDIIDDHTLQPMQRDLPAIQMGARSSMRFPIRFDNRVIGGVAFLSLEPGKYDASDVLVGRRLADHVATALSHYNLAQQLAEESRAAAALQERAGNLDLLDGLMSTITGVLDIREVLDRIFEISQRALTYDSMSIAVPIPETRRVTLYATTGALRGLETPMELPLGEPALLERDWDHVLIDDCRAEAKYAHIPSVKAGMRSLLIIPVKIEEELRAWVNFWSGTPGRFTVDDIPVARRIAAHITLTLSHERLAEQARLNQELRVRTANLELLDDYLATLTDTGDLRDVFERISAIARKVLPHDALGMPVYLPDGRHARRYASSGLGLVGAPEQIEIPEEFKKADWEYDLIDDVAAHSETHNQRAANMGFRSALRVPIRLDGKIAGILAFLSNTPAAFHQHDILAARRIADRVAVALARDRQIEASKRADEATERAAKLEARVQALMDELDARTGYRRVVGESPQWRQVLKQATQVAATEATVLLLGESGTGKEVVARFVHRGSSRSNGPFIALNCAALPEQLLEAELFGYERGAYTGATQSKPGQLEQAAGGTLFLDEVAEMSPSAQAKFLRVLQEREFQRLGGTRVLRTDARIVAATNRDLQKAIAQGQFREDLYYRLNVFPIRLPALRGRRDDILPLSEAFIGEIGRSLGRPPGGISRDARQMLVDYHWPGNVRELRNILERAAILCDGGLITAEHLALTASPVPSPALQPPVAAPAKEFAAAASAGPAMPATAGDLQSVERTMIEKALESARFNKSKAAKALGLTRHQLYIRMRKYGFEQ